MKYRFLKQYFFILLWFSTLSHVMAQEVSIGLRPDWATDFAAEEYHFDQQKVIGSHQFNWLDANQFHAGRKECVYDKMIGYYRYPSLSEYFEIHLDGSFQQIILHDFRIYRDGNWLDLTKDLQYEMKRFTSIFRGVEIAHYDILRLNLSALRVGDVLHVSYTEKGVQADLKGYTNLKSVVDESSKERYYLRLSYPTDATMQYFLSDADLPPPVKEAQGPDSVWLWDIRQVNNYNQAYAFKGLHESSIPSWYQLVKSITVSDLVEPSVLYELSRQNYQLDRLPSTQVIRFTEELLNGLSTKEEKVQQIFSFLQEDIYYLTNRYITPFQPEEVLDTRMGDCKAKSLLGVKMLASIGINAWRSSGFQFGDVSKLRQLQESPCYMAYSDV